MDKKIEKIVWNGETFYLPCPIYVDLDELSKRFTRYEYSTIILLLFMKSFTEWTKRMHDKDEDVPCEKVVESMPIVDVPDREGKNHD